MTLHNLTKKQQSILETYLNDKADFYKMKYGKYALPDHILNIKVCDKLIDILRNIEVDNIKIKGLNE